MARKEFQPDVHEWMLHTFGERCARDVEERNDRFIEESLELVQANGYNRDRAHALVDYVFDRPSGDRAQECGGVMVTLAALCTAAEIDMMHCSERELERIWTKVDEIRAKQAGKPTGSAIPIKATFRSIELIARERRRQVFEENFTPQHDRGHLTESALARASACYALPEGMRGLVDGIWPFDFEWWKPTPDDRIRELVKAGGLVAAEIDARLL